MSTMKITRAVRVKIISTGMEIMGFVLKKNIAKYKTTVVNVLEAGTDIGITTVDAINALKDKKLSYAEELDLVDKLSANKKSLDVALDSLIKDLKEHALDKTEQGE